MQLASINRKGLSFHSVRDRPFYEAYTYYKVHEIRSFFPSGENMRFGVKCSRFESLFLLGCIFQHITSAILDFPICKMGAKLLSNP